MGRKKIKTKVWETKLDPKTFLKFHNIEIQARDFKAHKLLKEVAKLQRRIDRSKTIIQQCEQNCEQETNRLLDECMERVIDHFAAQEIDFLQKIKMVIGKTILGKPTKATLMEALKKISDLVDNEMDEIEKGNTWTAEQEKPIEEQASGKE